VGIIEPTLGLVDEFFNGSTGESQYGETNFKGPWNSSNALHPVQSKIKGGEGLNVTPYALEPGTEKASPVDSTPVGQWTNGIGKKQKTIYGTKKKEAAATATVEV
jgi:Mn-containing catalase